MLAEMLGRALRIEALEDRFEVLLGNAMAFVVDGDDEGAAARLATRSSRPSSTTIREPGGLNDRALSITLRNTWP